MIFQPIRISNILRYHYIRIYVWIDLCVRACMLAKQAYYTV